MAITNRSSTKCMTRIFTPVWKKGYLKQFKAQLKQKKYDQYREQLDKIDIKTLQKDAEKRFQENQGLIIDDAAFMHVWLASLQIASYHSLLNLHIDREVALDIIKTAFLNTFRKSTKRIVHLLMHLAKDPLEKVQKRHFFISLLGKIYGVGFKFSYREAEDTADLIVNDCFYFNFFTKNGVPELTRTMCEWDYNWIDAINECGKPYYSECISRISEGANECHFCFHREAFASRKEEVTE